MKALSAFSPPAPFHTLNVNGWTIRKNWAISLALPARYHPPPLISTLLVSFVARFCCCNFEATIVDGGQGPSSKHPATVDQDGPDCVHARTLQPMGHGVEETQRNRGALAQPASHSAQEEMVEM